MTKSSRTAKMIVDVESEHILAGTDQFDWLWIHEYPG